MLKEPNPIIELLGTVGLDPPTPESTSRLSVPSEGGDSLRLEASLNAVIVMDAHGMVNGWNATAEEMFGISLAEAKNRNLADLIVPPEFRHAHEQGLQRYLATGAPQILNQTVEVMAMRRNGERFPAMLTVTTLPGDGEPLFLGALRDLSWQLAAETERREIEERFRTLVEQLPVVVFIDAADVHMTPLYVSPQIEQMLGYTPEEWLADPDLWLKSLHPDDRDEVCELALSWAFELPFEHEYRLVSKDGRTIWIREETVTIFGDDGNPRFSQGIFSDITSQKRTEERIREAEVRYRSLVEQTPAITFRTSSESLHDVAYVSPQIQGILGFEPEEWINDPDLLLNHTHPDDRERYRQATRDSQVHAKPLSLEYRQGTKTGLFRWLSKTTELVRDESGRPLYWQGILTDVTDRRTMEDAYSSLRDRYRHFAEYANDAIVAVDLNGHFLFANPAFHRLTGYEDEHLSRMNLSSIVHPESIEHAREISARLISGETPATDRESLALRTRDGRRLIVELSASIVRTNRDPIGFQAIIRDVTDRARLEAELEHQAYHDVLTNLPNRAMLLEQMRAWLGDEGTALGESALIFLDLDNFKVINDSLGHDVGDLALVEVGKRVQNCLRKKDFIARFGGDEFVILLRGLNRNISATDIAQRIVERFVDPFHIADREVKITASIGIAEFSRDVERPEELLRRADLAMYRSKERGRNRFALHNLDMDRVALDRLELEADLRRAIEHDELTVVYQRVVEMGTGRIDGVEALVRWVHPRRGQLAPSQFIPIAEESGLIVELDRWVLREALRQVWDLPGRDRSVRTSLSVNMSARQLDQADLVPFVDRVLSDIDIETEIELIFEITETAMMRDVEQARATLEALHSRGIMIALDDFGMGYSSLAQIRHLPVDYIKIDKQFIADISDQREDLVIVSGMIELSHSLGLGVVAEGVETATQAELLEGLGCDFAQGYFYGYPRPSAELERLLGDWACDSAPDESGITSCLPRDRGFAALDVGNGDK